MKKLFFTCAFCTMFFMFACQKEESNLDQIDEKAVSEETLSDVKKLQDIAKMVTNIATDNTQFNEIMFGVKANLEVGLDEQYCFKDILYPEQSKLKKLRTKSRGEFADKFIKLLKSDSKGITELEQFILDNDVQIYWPYSENWDGKTVPVITFDPKNGKEENIGYKIRRIKNNKTEIETVMVNDDYAYENPVWIINNSEISPDNMEEHNVIVPGGGGGSGGGGTNTTTNVVYQLSIGHVRSSKQYDNIFHGGSEFKFCILGGNIISMTSAESFRNISTVILDRRRIRTNSFKECWYELEDNWIKDTDNNETGRKFGLIEYDDKKTKYEMSFSPTVVVDKVSVSLGEISATFYSEESWIKTDYYADRDVFYNMQSIDMGHGLYAGKYRVFSSGNVDWTLPLRKFYY